jgi:hypothetical protein
MDDDLQRLERALTGVLAGLTAAQTQSTPTAHPQKWSIQQIADHLLRTYRSTVPALQVRIEKCSPTRAKPSPRQRVFQFLLLTLGHFPAGWQAPAAVAPSLPATVETGDELTAKIGRELAEIDRLTRLGERVFGKRRAATHMILGPLSMRQWRRFHLVHGLHHVRQIEAIRRDHRL